MLEDSRAPRLIGDQDLAGDILAAGYAYTGTFCARMHCHVNFMSNFVHGSTPQTRCGMQACTHSAILTQNRKGRSSDLVGLRDVEFAVQSNNVGKQNESPVG